MKFIRISPEDLDANLQMQILQIFFADKEFETEEAKNSFQERWMGPYFKAAPELCQFFLALDEKDQVLSYLVSGLSSDDYLKDFSESIKSYEVFEDLFAQYPAHLHINNKPEARGKGLGSQLMAIHLDYLKEKGISGVHLVTSPDAKNVSFYEKNGFRDKVIRNFRPGVDLLFMGQSLQN